jgi:hypothetical protein
MSKSIFSRSLAKLANRNSRVADAMCGGAAGRNVRAPAAVFGCAALQITSRIVVAALMATGESLITFIRP